MAENPVIPPDESLARGWSAPLMPRKIVQCAEIHGTLTVLCNDGTLWALVKGGKWIQPWPPIPQDAAHNLLARARLAERMAEVLAMMNNRFRISGDERGPSVDDIVSAQLAEAVLREWDALERGDGDA